MDFSFSNNGLTAESVSQFANLIRKYDSFRTVNMSRLAPHPVQNGVRGSKLIQDEQDAHHSGVVKDGGFSDLADAL